MTCYYIVLRHGNTDSSDNLLKKKYLKYAEKIVDYIHEMCLKKLKPPIFLSSPLDRAFESLQILITIYNNKYNTNHKQIVTNLLYRSGHEENSKAKKKRLIEFIKYTETFGNNYCFICVTHSSIIPALCPLISNISPEYFKLNHEVYLGEGALSFIKKNNKIIEYNKTFEKK